MKYEHVKIVAKTPCPRCDGVGRRPLHGGPPPGRGPGEIAVGTQPCAYCNTTGEVETELLHPGEPFFLVRAQDKLGPVTVGVYRALSLDAGADAEGLSELGVRMEEWQADNPGLVKLPD